MPRYLVIAHRTLGGEHLHQHLRAMAADDPSCQFHVVVPRFHPLDEVWSSGTTQELAEHRLRQMLDVMADEGLTGTGEVGTSNPMKAAAAVLDAQGIDSFSGCILSTLPQANSHWWQADLPRRFEKLFPSLPLTHLVAEDDRSQSA